MTIGIDLKPYEKKVFSQNGEDGVIAKIFEAIGFCNRYFVEIGVEDGRECNTRYLREAYNCQGILFDRDFDNPEIHLHQTLITAENINSIFAQYNIPSEFDLLAMDVDGNDFYLWLSLKKAYQPRAVIVEYNSSHTPQQDKVVHYSTLRSWDGTNYFGASILAWKNLAESKGYCLIYAESRGINLFFIRNDILKTKQICFQNMNDVDLLYIPPNYYGFSAYGKSKRGHPPDPLNRDYLTSQEILKTGQFKDIIEEEYQLMATPGESVIFAREAVNFLHPKLFKQGFYFPEANFTWLNGDYAFFLVKLNSSLPILMELKIVTVFLAEKNPLLEVEILINGRLIDIWKFQWGKLQDNITKFIDCSPQLTNSNSSPIKIELAIKGAVSPKSLGLSEDARNLSFALSQISFHSLTY